MNVDIQEAERRYAAGLISRSRIYQLRKAARGVCVTCTEPAEPGYSRCKDHQEYAKKHSAESYREFRGDREMYTCSACGAKGHNRRSCKKAGSS